jgi:Lar family restriction alleviation protein
MTVSELLPCPFCGSAAKVRSYRLAEDSEGSHVECTKCFARTDGLEDAYADRAGAIDLWNQRTALTAALSGQVVVPEVIDNGKTNPLIVVSPDQVNAWLRSLADAAGYSDRGSCAIQVKVAHELGDTIRLGSPELVLMVSNIKGSRAAPPPSSTAGEVG